MFGPNKPLLSQRVRHETFAGVGQMAGQYSSMTGYDLLIGRNAGTPVIHECKAPFAFTGKLNKVTVELK